MELFVYSVTSVCQQVIMKTISLYFLAFLALGESEDEGYARKRRGYFKATYPPGSNPLQIGGIDVENYAKSESQQADSYSPRAEKYLPLSRYADFDLTGPSQSSDFSQISQVDYDNSNAVDKPVEESQEYIPPQSVGTVIIPVLPPPATPVNAAALNVPVSNGAVFLGSGSLGVIDLGGGAYALGSGAIGYSERRSNPRSSFKAPLLPPVQAAQNLIPAAVNSPTPPPPRPPIVQFSYPVTGQQLPTDQNGYEYLPPNRVGFGDPLPPRPLKTRNSFATPTALQLPTQQLPSAPFHPSQPDSSQILQDSPPSQLLQAFQSQQPIGSDKFQIYGRDIPSLYSSSYMK